MVRTIFLGLSAGALALGVAMAQESPVSAPDEAAADETSIDDILGEPPSELDLLSRTDDKAFPELEETLKRHGVSVTVRALDKITARYTDVETPIGEPVKFGSLEILPRYCDKRPPEEFPETTAFLEIFDRDLSRARAAASVEARPLNAKDAAPAMEMAAAEVAAAEETEETPTESAADPDRIFSGWMFASSPALNPLEHAVYDVWVIDCKTEVVDN
ncbi:MAG TPA: DUF2155 domain-containing protein [Parvularculaceae bacterium]|nr:DUF2155 domain-containing protein [Amphiplicatus sp.]HPE30794.1 DUF2155 domain-containing protein [Parvularculaceae bacterium]HRX38442.1 DUF2155 domain-containing protein [Parvularculaceae bacterium]